MVIEEYYDQLMVTGGSHVNNREREMGSNRMTKYCRKLR